jgi:bifunctional DNA-binding transcriptional regulator/antitoxin component of YhaV-PrlF toxin-antitoxin module
MGEASVGQVRVTERGQMSLPAQARHRWGLDAGGEIGWVDLGDLLLLVPGGATQARAALLHQLTDEDWADAAAGFGDAELANQ